MYVPEALLLATDTVLCITTSLRRKRTTILCSQKAATTTKTKHPFPLLQTKEDDAPKGKDIPITQGTNPVFIGGR
jgi:hypothetical protein